VQVRWLRTALANLNAEAETSQGKIRKPPHALLLRSSRQEPSHGRVPGTRELVVPNTEQFIIRYSIQLGHPTLA
jgi:hypothetical protein